MSDSSLYKLDIATVFSATLILFVGTATIAHWWGKRTRTKFPEKAESMLEMIPSTILGLLALLLGFSFSMAISRFDTRKLLVNDEANAIGTAYLRTEILPPALQQRSRLLLRQYVSERLQFFESIRTSDTRTDYFARIGGIQDELWQLGMENAQTDRTAVSSLYLQSLNELIDLDAKRLFAARDKVPDAVYFTLVIVAIFGLCSLSLLFGWHGRTKRSLILLSLLFTIVISLIQDLDRPGRGMVRVNLSSLEDLNAKLKMVEH